MNYKTSSSEDDDDHEEHKPQIPSRRDDGEVKTLWLALQQVEIKLKESEQRLLEASKEPHDDDTSKFKKEIEF